jgi:hypothetical protein
MSIDYIAPKSKKAKRTRKRSLWTSIPRAPFPDRSIQKLKYVDMIQLDATTAVVPAVWNFSCNGLWDPNQTGTGHQPMGFDQYATLYNHYHVMESYIKVIFMAPDDVGSGAKHAAIIGIMRNNDASDSRSTKDRLEESSTVYDVIHGDGPGTKQLTLGYKEKAIFPVDKRGDTHGAINANPQEQTSFQVFCAAITTGNDPSPIKAVVEINYLCEFYERQDLVGS